MQCPLSTMSLSGISVWCHCSIQNCESNFHRELVQVLRRGGGGEGGGGVGGGGAGALIAHVQTGPAS